MFLAKSIDPSQREVFNKCLSEISKDRNVLLAYKNGFKIPIDATGSQIDEFKKMKEKQKSTKLKNIFNNDRLFNFEGMSRAQKVNLLAPTIEILSSEENVLSLVMKVYLYLHLNNMGRVESLLSQIYKIDPTSHFVLTNPDAFEKELRVKILERLLLMMNYIEETLDDKLKYNMLKIVISRFFEFGEDKNFFKLVKAELSLQEIRTVIKSPNYGLRYPTIWFPILYQRVSFIEAIEFLEKSLLFIDFDSEIKDILWIFQVYFPRNEALRIKILSHVLKLKDSKGMKEQELYFRLQENEKIRNAVVKRGYKRPIFTQKRKFYRSLIEKGVSINYSLFQLLKLGDNQDSYFLWKTL